MVRQPKQASKGKKKASTAKAVRRAPVPPPPDGLTEEQQQELMWEWRYGHLPGRSRKGLPGRASFYEREAHRERTGEAYVPRQGAMTNEVFEEMVLLLFGTKAAFISYTGISSAQVQRYCTARSPVPRDVAILIACIAAQQRHGLPLPELTDVTG